MGEMVIDVSVSSPTVEHYPMPDGGAAWLCTCGHRLAFVAAPPGGIVVHWSRYDQRAGTLDHGTRTLGPGEDVAAAVRSAAGWSKAGAALSFPTPERS